MPPEALTETTTRRCAPAAAVNGGDLVGLADAPRRSPRSIERDHRACRAPRMRTATGAGLALFALLAASGVAEACSPREPTPPGFLGPHDFSTAPATDELWREGDPGEQLVLSLRVLDTCGRSLPGATIHLLHADGNGAHRPGRYRALLETDGNGEVHVLTVVPGYAGNMARHIHFIVRHPDHAKLITRLYFRNDPGLDASPDDPLVLLLDEMQVGDVKRWVTGYEFVLRPRGG